MRIKVTEEHVKAVCGSISRARKLYYSGFTAKKSYGNLIQSLICETALAEKLDVPHLPDVANIQPYDFMYKGGLKIDVKSFSINKIEYAEKLNFLVSSDNLDKCDLFAFCVYETSTDIVHYVSIMPVNAFKGVAKHFKKGESTREGYKPLTRDCWVLPYTMAASFQPSLPQSGKDSED